MAIDIAYAQYTIEDIDYWENDAFLVIGSQKQRFYFQFTDEPTIEAALNFLAGEISDAQAPKPEPKIKRRR